LQIDIFDKAVLLVPVHLPGHWALGVMSTIIIVVDVTGKRISYWDSWKQCVPPNFFENIR
ncbi:unnamed protein product, partial [Porites lobata]